MNTKIAIALDFDRNLLKRRNSWLTKQNRRSSTLALVTRRLTYIHNINCERKPSE
ncbi:hypothetical protein HYC85_028062 [Camellia sinensis]|uniref:Uncharacterized protein n=1 Tax=Camellia sinensis TaxID=4442 RepID=A0A7J7FV70_CAMSI|nr:hypothetical protein HYC85_028062 [Camellia sinensis]